MLGCGTGHQQGVSPSEEARRPWGEEEWASPQQQVGVPGGHREEGLVVDLVAAERSAAEILEEHMAMAHTGLLEAVVRHMDLAGAFGRQIQEVVASSQREAEILKAALTQLERTY